MTTFGFSFVQFIEVLALIGVVLWLVLTWKHASSGGWLIQRCVSTVFLIALPFGAVSWYWAKVGASTSALVFTFLMVGLVGVGLLLLWPARLAGIIAQPLYNLFYPNESEGERPVYSMAQSRIKQGRYHEALELINLQLAKFPTDMELYVIKGELLADQMGNFPKALETFEEFLHQKTRSSKNKAFVLNRMADLILKYSGEIDQAIVTVQRIIEMAPNSDAAQSAEARIGRLEERRVSAAAPPRSLTVKRVETYPQKPTGVHGIVEAPIARNADARIGELIGHLKIQPCDPAAREELALIYGTDLKLAELGMEQLDILVSLPGTSPQSFAKWMNMKADIATKVLGDVDIAHEALDQIIRGFPNSPAATNATKRIALLKLEISRHKNAQPVKLGVYEQNIGLKSQYRGS